MAKTTTNLERRLKECKTIRECFTIQNSLVDGLSEEEELELRAKYAGLTVEEAKLYQDALKTVKFFEAKAHTEKTCQKMTEVICNLVCR